MRDGTSNPPANRPLNTIAYSYGAEGGTQTVHTLYTLSTRCALVVTGTQDPLSIITSTTSSIGCNRSHCFALKLLAPYVPAYFKERATERYQRMAFLVTKITY
ncbi:MAG: hypothetical protein QOF94_25 [Acidobacteriaceae bacterium]